LRLKKAKITEGIPVIYSNEITERELLPLEKHQEEDPNNFRPLQNIRVRTVPVLGTMPAIFGQAIAAYV
jgi:hypothetical protein